MVKKYLENSRGSKFRVLPVIIRDKQVSKCEKFYDAGINDWTHSVLRNLHKTRYIWVTVSLYPWFFLS
jgi:hypothetical protein